MIKTVATLLISAAAAQAAIASDPLLMMYQDSEQTILSWSVDDSDVLRQEVYRQADSYSKPELIAVLNPNDRTFEDPSALPYNTNYYQIKAVLDNDKVLASNLTNAYDDGLKFKSKSSDCKAGSTISGKTVDCKGARVGLACDGDKEGQKPVFTLKNATIKNVRISKSGGADGIHCKSGTCTLENVIWEDICEDAATNNGKKLIIKGGVAFNFKKGPGGKPDKVFQHNSKNSTTVIQGGFTLVGEHGKLYRSCGNCTNNGGPRHLIIKDVKVNAKIGSIAGVNGNYKDTVTISNLKIKDYKKGSPKVCVEYKGIQKGKGESKKIGEKWDTKVCNVSSSDVKKL